MGAWGDFKQAVADLGNAIHTAEYAVKIPDTAYLDARRVEVGVRQSGTRDVKGEEIAAKIRSGVEAEYVKEARAERDRRLAASRATIESIRAALPAMAAAAAVELGVIARGMVPPADQGGNDGSLSS